MTQPSSSPNREQDRDDFYASLRTGLVVGTAALVILLPALHYWRKPVPTTFPSAAVTVSSGLPAAAAPVVRPARLLASFGNFHPTDAVRQIANWSVHSGDHQKMAIVVVDKKDARVWVFDPRGELLSASPALLGAAIGDYSVPGIGEKPLSQVKPNEKTTPAGRFGCARRSNRNAGSNGSRRQPPPITGSRLGASTCRRLSTKKCSVPPSLSMVR
jgi:hypothetical protein